MEVMDLSLPKPHQIPSYSPPSYTVLPQQYERQYMLQQQHYLLQQQHLLQQLTTNQPATVIPPQLSVNHLGFFQQLKYDDISQAVPVVLPPSPIGRTSPIRYDTTNSYAASTVDSTKEKEYVKNKEANNNNCRTHVNVKRPFKLIVSAKNPTSHSLPAIIDPNSDEAYEEYRSKVLSQVVKGELEPNRNMRRTIPSNPEKSNDPEYLERRKKNNEAAKKSREARKAKEDEIAIRVSFLEQENLKLKFQLAAIERQKKMYLLRLEEQQKRHNRTACF